MANVLGSLLVDLQCNTASFQEGLSKASYAATSSSKAISSAFTSTNYSMLEARHGVMLLGEEFGVRMPRAVSTLLASIAPVGSVMAAAFPILGALALVDVIGKVIDHFDKASEQASLFSRQEREVQDKAALATQALDLENLKLDDQIRKLTTGAAPNKIGEQVLEINKQLGELGGKIDADAAKFEKFTKLGLGKQIVDWFDVSHAIDNSAAATQRADASWSAFEAALHEMDVTPSTENQKALAAAIKSTQTVLQQTVSTLESNQHWYNDNAEAVDFYTKKIEELGEASKQAALIQDNVAKQARLGAGVGIQAALPLTPRLPTEGLEVFRQFEPVVSSTATLFQELAQRSDTLSKATLELISPTKQLTDEDRTAVQVHEDLKDAVGKASTEIAKLKLSFDAGKISASEFGREVARIDGDLNLVSSTATKFGTSLANIFSNQASRAVDDFTHSLGEFIVTGRGSFIQALQQIEEAIVSAIAKLLIMKALMAIGGAIGGPVGGFITGVAGGLQGGGDVVPGQAFVVGEKRPELFVPSVPGHVYPTVPTMGGGGGNMTVNLHNSISAIDATGVRELLKNHGELFATEMFARLRARNAIA